MLSVAALARTQAMLLLLLADVQPGDTVLDPFGGSGTIAIEAAVRVPRVEAITSDNHRPTSRTAIRNIKCVRRGVPATRRPSHVAGAPKGCCCRCG